MHKHKHTRILRVRRPRIQAKKQNKLSTKDVAAAVCTRNVIRSQSHLRVDPIMLQFFLFPITLPHHHSYTRLLISGRIKNNRYLNRGIMQYNYDYQVKLVQQYCRRTCVSQELKMIRDSSCLLTASVCSSSRTPSLWSTEPLTSLPGHVRQLPDMQELGSSNPASIAASSRVVSASQVTSWIAPSHSIFTWRTPAPPPTAYFERLCFPTISLGQSRSI